MRTHHAPALSLLLCLYSRWIDRFPSAPIIRRPAAHDDFRAAHEDFRVEHTRMCSRTAHDDFRARVVHILALRQQIVSSPLSLALTIGLLFLL